MDNSRNKFFQTCMPSVHSYHCTCDMKLGYHSLSQTVSNLTWKKTKSPFPTHMLAVVVPITANLKEVYCQHSTACCQRRPRYSIPDSKNCFWALIWLCHWLIDLVISLDAQKMKSQISVIKEMLKHWSHPLLQNLEDIVTNKNCVSRRSMFFSVGKLILTVAKPRGWREGVLNLHLSECKNGDNNTPCQSTHLKWENAV